jgi:hypothetical protein
MMLFDSTMAFSARASSLRNLGMAAARLPTRVRTQKDRTAPAAR